MNTPYCTVQDRFGARAVVYFKNDDNHSIVYQDDSGHKFFTEEFNHVPIETVEQYAIDWAKGKRELA
jgi:hypothetical protein